VFHDTTAIATGGVTAAENIPDMGYPVEISVVIPTLSNQVVLGRVLDGYARQDAPPGSFEVVVVADRAEPDPSAVDEAVGERPYPVRRISGRVPGASGSRNAGWQAARAPIVLFTDDDTLPVRGLVSEHLEWHRRHPPEAVAVLGHVRWAPELKVTPFMKWLDLSVQFGYTAIDGTEASWAHLYSSNASLKRNFLARIGGYDEARFPYGYEDLDLGLRARDHGLRVLYNRRAAVDHLRSMTVELWQARAPRLAASERRFCELHPEVAPWFWRMFSDAAARPPLRGRAARLARFVPRWVPWAGPRVWRHADVYWRQQIAPYFLTAWEAASSGAPAGVAPDASALAERAAGGAAPDSPARELESR
jgi:GT2 family glycosyltransferase